jgi:hypothetical protein
MDTLLLFCRLSISACMRRIDAKVARFFSLQCVACLVGENWTYVGRW